ncbi:methyltransferase domain-containing protein [Blastococcus sp. TML/M2B]|uniref:class I SAM-dependent methyltransferase n=1 Tax=unclassified Blastococcus TaxID=2619396 RepID=UPI00190AF0AF|nr:MULTISPECIES: class I SAM-dependent methyltransferase [unclassified Blastococcus]MBN1092020.1 methyltransferase domain-containing protein [Blastococcus sp. TML/M2B]MBN1097879.1 methyltransferase domain-containing protein [Blastococcus sp. TML/C7B]
MTSPGSPLDRWASGERYEAYVGRWSRAVATTFVHWLEVPPGARWLDAGCGTGAPTTAILELGSPAAVLGADTSPDLLARAAGTVHDARARFVLADVAHLPVDDGSVDAAVSGLVLNFVPDTSTALAEAVRVTRRGGAVAAYVWDYAEGMELIRYFWDAAVALDPGAAQWDEGTRFPLCHPWALAGAFDRAGLAGVVVEPIVVPTAFHDLEEYWHPFLGGTGPAPAYVASLPEERVTALRDRLAERLPASPDGGIRLSARAWAVRGEVRHPRS